MKFYGASGMSQVEPGARINNYLLDEQIAAGSFGEVWRAHHHVFNERVAVKIPTDPQYVRHLQREGMAIHGLKHPNIVRALDMDPYGDPPYLIMEFVDGPSVRHLIDAEPKGLSIETTVPMMYGMLSALTAAHEAGVVHRDIKPGNILIAGGPDLAHMTPERVKVTDFGLGRLSQSTRESMMQSGSIAMPAGRHIAGTMAYMSPEQRDGREVDARSDLYSAGVMLHEMLTGMLPQGSDLPSSIRREVPRWLDEMFSRCCTRRDHRYESARQMQQIIERYFSPARNWSRLHPAGEARMTRLKTGNGWQCAACCGRVDADDQFCIHCGRQLVDRVPRCSSCQAYVGRNDNFCIMCGAALHARV